MIRHPVMPSQGPLSVEPRMHSNSGLRLVSGLYVWPLTPLRALNAYQHKHQTPTIRQTATQRVTHTHTHTHTHTRKHTNTLEWLIKTKKVCEAKYQKDRFIFIYQKYCIEPVEMRLENGNIVTNRANHVIEDDNHSKAT